MFKSLKEGISFPTIGLDEKDPECDLFYTPNVFVKKDLKYAISSSFGFCVLKNMKIKCKGAG